MADENRLKWTDVDWARHLGCSAKIVVESRKWLESNIFANVNIDPKTETYGIEVSKRHDTPSGAFRTIPIMTIRTTYKTADDCIKYANEKFIPTLELTRFWAQTYGVPQRTLQMLRVGNVR